MSNLLSAVLAVLSGWVLALFAEPVHQRIFGPRLELVFKDTEHFVTHIKEGSPSRFTKPSSCASKLPTSSRRTRSRRVHVRGIAVATGGTRQPS